MRRLPVAAFVALVIATVAAFFVTQHLKVTTPLIQGSPSPRPAAFNPVDGKICRLRNHAGVRVPVNFKRMQISFYLQHRADDVDVYIVDQDQAIVDTLASGRHMAIDRRSRFTWDGRETSGTIAPDGSYYIRVSLVHQGRSFLISNPSGAATVTVERHAPRLTVTRVTTAGGASPAVIPQAAGSEVRIHFAGAGVRRPRVLVYRTDLPSGPVLVKSFNATSKQGQSLWNGTLKDGAPAPQGTYLVGLTLTDQACNTARFPLRMPPAPGVTPHAGVTVRYLAAQPPVGAVAPGSDAVVGVDAGRHRYAWALRRAGAQPVLRSGRSSAYALSVPLPAGGPGLYELALRWGGHRTVVPLVAGEGSSARARPRGSGRGRVLVVLPALTWQGENPVDDDYDGMPNTLTAGQPIRLLRPLVNGLPAGFADEAALVAHLRRARLKFDLTTDLGLLLGGGPPLQDFSGVVLAGSERWLPDSLGSSLSTFVEGGGHVLSLGIDSLRRSVTVAGGQAMDPSAPRASDFLLARPGPVVLAHGSLILVDKDGLRIFSGTSGALRGYRSYQPTGSVSAPARILSAAGVSNGQPSIVGYRLGRGTVVDIGLPGFGSSLRRNLDAQELLGRVWQLLGS
ncbi:MAG: FlgD immunoglobulin-like domain containing protein [Solirubrobacteraceae bacterium]